MDFRRESLYGAVKLNTALSFTPTAFTYTAVQFNEGTYETHGNLSVNLYSSVDVA